MSPKSKRALCHQLRISNPPEVRSDSSSSGTSRSLSTDAPSIALLPRGPSPSRPLRAWASAPSAVASAPATAEAAASAVATRPGAPPLTTAPRRRGGPGQAACSTRTRGRCRSCARDRALSPVRRAVKPIGEMCGGERQSRWCDVQPEVAAIRGYNGR